MAEPFDSTKPDGGLPIALGDDAIRDNGLAIMRALQGEHDFIDASTNEQSGKHSFQIDSDQEIFDVPKAGPPLVGSIAFSTDRRTGWNVLVVWDGAEWVSADINPLTDPEGLPTLPRLGENHNWTKSQNATWGLQTLGAGTGPGGVDLLTMDFSDSPYKRVSITADTFIADPIGLPTVGDGVVVNLDIAMDATGLHTITFDASYRAQGGLVQISTEASSKTMLSLMVLLSQTPEVLVTSLPNYNIGGVTASGQIS
jgi:hypothetical protein